MIYNKILKQNYNRHDIINYNYNNHCYYFISKLMNNANVLFYDL